MLQALGGTACPVPHNSWCVLADFITGYTTLCKDNRCCWTVQKTLALRLADLGLSHTGSKQALEERLFEHATALKAGTWQPPAAALADPQPLYIFTEYGNSKVASSSCLVLYALFSAWPPVAMVLAFADTTCGWSVIFQHESRQLMQLLVSKHLAESVLLICTD